MTLFFNLNNLEKDAGDDLNRYVFLLRQLYLNKRLPSKKDKYPPAKYNLVGNSFILNAGPLFDEKVDIAYIVQYIRLAGRRDYMLYKEYGTTSLPLSFFPDINLKNIIHNPLLKITEDEIFFKYERNKNGISI